MEPYFQEKVYPEWMTQQEVTEYTHNSIRNIIKKTSTGVIPVHRGIGTSLYKKSEIDKIISEE